MAFKLKPSILLICILPAMTYGGSPARSNVMVREALVSGGRGAGKLTIRLDGKAGYEVRTGSRKGLFTIFLYNAALAPGLAKTFRLAHGKFPSLVTITQPRPSVVKITIRTRAEIVCDEWLTDEDTSSITIQAGSYAHCNVYSPGYGSASAASSRRAKARPAAAPKAEAARRGPLLGDLLRLSGQAANDTAYALKQPTGFSKMQNSLVLTGSGNLSEEVSYKASGRFYHDSVYDLTSRYSPAVARDQRDAAELRDAYVDLSAGNADIRAGRQQVVWGEAVGTYIADVVNPRDMREFVLQDFDLARIPQWSLDAEYTLGDLHFEGVWVPFPEFNRLGLPGSQFVFSAPLPPGAFPVVAKERVPASTFKNGEYGARVSWLTSGWDLTAFGMRAWDKFAAYPRTITPTPFGSLYAFAPEHNRLSISGATFTKEAWDYVFKGEAAYTNGKALALMDSRDPTGIVFRDTLDAMVGADHTFYKKVDANAQLIHRRVFGYSPEIFQETRTSTFASLWLKMGFFNGKLEPELLIMSGLNAPGERLLRPKVTLKPGGNIEFVAGLDIFHGSARGLFGQFTGSSRGYLKTRYVF